MRTLAPLERELGMRLLNRAARRLHLTDEGAQYLDHCRVILAAVQDFELRSPPTRRSRAEARADVVGDVRPPLQRPVAADFIERHPEVTAEFLFVDRVVSLVDEGIDVANRIGRLKDSSLVAIRVGAVRRLVCASPQYLQRHGVPRKHADATQHACVRHTGLGPRSEWLFRMGRRDVAIPVNAVVTCNEIDSALTACTRGVGLGMFLPYQVAPGRTSGDLKYVLEDFETEPLPVHVIYPQTRLMSARVRAFVDECVTKLRGVAFD